MGGNSEAVSTFPGLPARRFRRGFLYGAIAFAEAACDRIRERIGQAQAEIGG
jgi:hypothetical protein